MAHTVPGGCREGTRDLCVSVIQWMVHRDALHMGNTGCKFDRLFDSRMELTYGDIGLENYVCHVHLVGAYLLESRDCIIFLTGTLVYNLRLQSRLAYVIF